MILFWRIRYYDSSDKQFKDRDLWLDTSTLAPALGAAVEMCSELRDTGGSRTMLKYRHLFKSEEGFDGNINDQVRMAGMCNSVLIHDYFEDENGKELNRMDLAQVVTGSPTAMLLPPGAKQHDIDYMLAEKRAIPIDLITLTDKQLSVLGYFARDLREMTDTAFLKDGPGELVYAGKGAGTVETAVSDDEIRSFVTIFRRLYMTNPENDHANFMEAVDTFSEVLGDHPLAAWVQGVASQYKKCLGEAPQFIPHAGRLSESFTCKRIIDVFIYTQYAHQPSPRRQRQYEECLAELNGRSALLFWLFLSQLQACACHFRNAGQMIANFYQHYCKQKGVAPRLLKSVSDEHPAIGTLEKKKDREVRIRREKIEKLAKQLWHDSGRPAGGDEQFIQQAKDQLDEAMK